MCDLKPFAFLPYAQRAHVEQHSKSAGKKAPAVTTVTAGESPATSGDEGKRTRDAASDWLTFVHSLKNGVPDVVLIWCIQCHQQGWDF